MERTNSWLLNYGQLRRNTDRKPQHRLAQLALAIALLITGKLIDWQPVDPDSRPYPLRLSSNLDRRVDRQKPHFRWSGAPSILAIGHDGSGLDRRVRPKRRPGGAHPSRCQPKDIQLNWRDAEAAALLTALMAAATWERNKKGGRVAPCCGSISTPVS